MLAWIGRRGIELGSGRRWNARRATRSTCTNSSRRPGLRSTTLFGSLRGAAAAAVLLLSLGIGVGANADSLAVVDPLPPGPYAAGCSNVAQDFSRVQPGERAQNYWEGYPDGSRGRYVTQLLADPADGLVVKVWVPADRGLYTNRPGRQVR